jgi:hypothetical protein
MANAFIRIFPMLALSGVACSGPRDEPPASAVKPQVAPRTAVSVGEGIPYFGLIFFDRQLLDEAVRVRKTGGDIEKFLEHILIDTASKDRPLRWAVVRGEGVEGSPSEQGGVRVIESSGDAIKVKVLQASDRAIVDKDGWVYLGDILQNRSGTTPKLNLPIKKALPVSPPLVAKLGARPDEYVPQPKQARDLELLAEYNFSKSTADDTGVWEVVPRETWRVSTREDNRALELYSAGVRAPGGLAPQNLTLLRIFILKDIDDLVLDLKVCPTGEKGRRNFCLVLNYRDPEHLYYINVQEQDDGKSSGIFRVDGKSSVSIAEAGRAKISLGEGWHRVRLARRWQEGLIEFYFDDMDTPAMTAHDKVLRGGYVGFGSFNGTGFFDDTQMWGKMVP